MSRAAKYLYKFFIRYHRGQTVQVEGKKARFSGVIWAIGTEAVTDLIFQQNLCVIYNLLFLIID